MEQTPTQLEKNVNDIVDIVVAIKSSLENFQEETRTSLQEIDVKLKEVDTKLQEVDNRFEIVESKIDGLQRSVDTAFERQGSLEARIAVVEVGV